MRLSVKATSPSTLGLKINELKILLDKDTALKLSTELHQEANKIGRAPRKKRKRAGR